MNMPTDWLAALQRACKKLEQTPAAPPWLAQALAAALTVAPALAPASAPEEHAPAFLYPH